MSFGQGGPQWGPGGPDAGPPNWGSGSDTPDWAALAEASEARARRRRWLWIGGSALATVVVGALVAMAVVSANSSSASNQPADELPTSADIPSDTTQPGPSFEATTAPPPLDPKDFVSSVKKDTAPLSADTLFPGSSLTMGERIYKKGSTSSTTKCATAVRGALAKVLTSNDCTRVIRATYSRKGVAVTVGVALFDTEAKATKAKQEWDKGNVASLSGSGVPAFCTTAVCRSTANSYGRYAYFTVSGFTNGKNVTQKDSAVFTTGDDLAEFTFRQIRRRGEAQASAAANSPAS
ncbi:hypothetical protein [Streptomyces himalayensis]|uniref:Uncharacterized protein n=1 Tax=Streptomyces himalayensis subsp. himalayensis TaxID=2756131 RepID=A0A7W0IAA8_9ACTN|nr:hypothetical protein [Streptomyces himalayensis]MBA2948153.1 hypothetical protein [Streptomyces himalayensis subsp. himalayensis]